MSGDGCPACGVEIDWGKFACTQDWKRLPVPYQRAINSAWKRRKAAPGDKGARAAHEAAKAAAVGWFERNPRDAS